MLARSGEVWFWLVVVPRRVWTVRNSDLCSRVTRGRFPGTNTGWLFRVESRWFGAPFLSGGSGRF